MAELSGFPSDWCFEQAANSGSSRCLRHPTTISKAVVKVPMKQIFYYRIRKSFQNDEEWHLFYCDSTLGC